MTTQESNNKILIGVNSLKGLFSLNNGFTFNIPDYQRPYVWDEEKIEALFKDIAEELLLGNLDGEYYMGAILLHRKDNAILDIIDGQQRITTLLILDYIINEDNCIIKTRETQLQLFYNSTKSQENIAKNADFIRRYINRFFPNGQLHNLLDNLIFTVIVTESEDDAFVFFDTQNNRGVKLSAVDFLKSYHLKALKGENEELEKQTIAARNWDKSNQNQFLDKLFNIYLWRGRTWKGKRVDYENKDKILKEFQKETRRKPTDNSISLYPCNKNKLATSIKFSAKKGINIRTNDISLGAEPLNYPFSFRQPIEKGMSFFLFTDKYNSLYRYIFLGSHESESDLYRIKEFYETVYQVSGFSHYFTDIFQLCVLLYYDKFEEQKLYEFVLWLDYLLGSYRIKQKSIVAQTPVKIIRDGDQNLFDVIDNAFLPNEIIDFLKSITSEDYYGFPANDTGVRGAYKAQLEVYYGEPKNSNLSNKEQWIYAKLKNN